MDDAIATTTTIKVGSTPTTTARGSDSGNTVAAAAVLEAIAAETGVRYEDSLRDDDLPGAPGEAQHSLLELLRYNYRTMILGLGGQPTQLDALVIERTVPDTAFYPQ
jgi:hypothetical protein